MSDAETVLVTGGSGFIGGDGILRLLAAGYRVKTAVHKLAREPEVPFAGESLVKLVVVKAG